jgi:hypothetical protein
MKNPSLSSVALFASAVLISSLPVSFLHAEDAAPAPAAPTADPKWWEQMLAREAAPVAVHEVVGVESAFKASSAATVAEAPKVVSPGIQSVLLSIGSERPMACQVFTTTSVNLADSATELSNEIFGNIVKSAGKGLQRNVYRLDVGTFGAVPYALMEWVFTTGAAQDKDSDHLKVAVATRDQRSVICSHMEIGYSQSFQRAFQSLATTLTVKGEVATPAYTRITTLAANGQRFAISREEYFPPANGRVVHSHQVSTLLGIDAHVVRSSEEGTLEVTTPDGRMLNATSVNAANGQETSNLTLKQVSEPNKKGWLVEGKYQGAPHSAWYDDQPVSSALGRSLAIRSLIATHKPGTVKEYTLWRGTKAPRAFSHLKLEAKTFTPEGMAAVEEVPAPKAEPGTQPQPAPANGPTLVQFSRTGVEKMKPTAQMGEVKVDVTEEYVHGAIPGQ